MSTLQPCSARRSGGAAIRDDPITHLVTLLMGKRGDGTPRFSENERRMVLPVLTLLTGQSVSPSEWPQLWALVRELLQRLGLPPDAGAAQITAALTNGRLQGVLSQDLLSAVSDLVQQELVDGGDPEQRRRALRFLAASPDPTPTEERQAPAEAPLKAGPLAQYEAGRETRRGK